MEVYSDRSKCLAKRSADGIGQSYPNCTWMHTFLLAKNPRQLECHMLACTLSSCSWGVNGRGMCLEHATKISVCILSAAGYWAWGRDLVKQWNRRHVMSIDLVPSVCILQWKEKLYLDSNHNSLFSPNTQCISLIVWLSELIIIKLVPRHWTVYILYILKCLK